MAATFGDKIKVTLFGQSHSEAMGAVVDGVPAGLKIDMEALDRFMARRAPGGEFATKRKEADKVRFISGLGPDGLTCGAPICMIIENTDARSADYDKLKALPRPSHSDYAAFIKYGGHNDIRGGGQFSGRLTAPMCAAGFICKTLLEQKGVKIISHIYEVYGVQDQHLPQESPSEELFQKLATSHFAVIDDKKAEQMKDAIKEASSTADSVGGITEVGIYGLEPGLGEPFFGSVESLISQTMFAVPAVKGIEFGAGFDFAKMKGSQANDPFITDKEGKPLPKTNNCGGILGGITSGMPIIFRAVFKPTPSIGIEQDTVNLMTGKAEKLTVTGRHDPCILTRTPSVCEAAAAIAIVNLN